MIIEEGNCAGNLYPRKKTIHSFFEEMAIDYPNRSAVEFNNEQITYCDLNKSAERLATILKQLNIAVGNVIAISTERSINMVTAILAILKIGAVYLPIETDNPEERKLYYLKTANAKVILSTERNKMLFGIPNINIEDIPDDIMPTPNPSITSDTLAYIIFTSGSTGNPKGVMVRHYSVVNRLLWMKEQYGFDENNVFLQKTPCSFDVSIWELFLWFFCGAKLCLLPSGYEGSAEAIINAVHQHKVTACHFVPSMLEVFLEYLSHRGGADKLSSLQKVFSSGEALRYDLVTEFRNVLKRENPIQLHNLYGPTEATVDVTYFDCTNYEPIDGIVPIGKPIWNTRIYVLDDNGAGCANGDKGEIYISGDGVAAGYINNSELTDKVFLPDPICNGATMYKTGDLGRWHNGVLEYLGRADNQVKIHGIRIELEEIENQMLKHEKIKQVIMIAVGDSEKRLVAYYNGSEAIEHSAINDHLSQILPPYMIPAEFIFMDKFPLTQSGKVDRKKVALSYQDKESSNSEENNQIMKVIRDVVGREIKEEDNLSQSDIDSITFIKIVVALESEFDFEFDDEMLLITKFPTVKTMIEYVESMANTNCEV